MLSVTVKMTYYREADHYTEYRSVKMEEKEKPS